MLGMRTAEASINPGKMPTERAEQGKAVGMALESELLMIDPVVLFEPLVSSDPAKSLYVGLGQWVDDSSIQGFG